MRKIYSNSTLSILILFFFVSCLTPEKNYKHLKPPIAEKKDSILTIHGHQRTDPYFWMRLTDEQKNAENPDMQTQKVLDYLKAENAYTKNALQHTQALQDTLFNEIVGRIKKDDASVPYFDKGYWYYTRYEKEGEYPIYSRKKESLEAKEEIILNVNTLAAKYSYYLASGLNVSPNQQVLAFGEDTVSRRVYTIKFKDLQTGKFLSDQLPNSTGHGAWSNDGQYFFYTTKNPTSLLAEKIWRHKMGTSAKQDQLVYEEKDPSFYIGVYKSKSDKYITIWNSSTLVSDYHILDANNPTGKFKQFIPREDKHEYSIYHFKNKFYVLTNWEAENFRLMEVEENDTKKENWKEVIQHRSDVLLEGLDVFQNFLVLDERKEGLTQLRIINQQNGEEHYLDFGESAYTAYTTTNIDFNTTLLRYGYTSMTTPNSIFDYDMQTRNKELKKQQEVVGGHDPSAYTTERLWAKSRDGVKIPISIVYKNDFKKDGSRPLLLYAYGSYGNTIDAYFSSTRLSLLDRGFAYAIAHIRGGQMMGRKWYENGKLLKKKNTFYDFIDCAQTLIDKKYTSSESLYAMGGSAGGLLMGAVINMRPELFKGVVAAVPFVDVVSTMLDESIPLTTNEFDEWGNPKNKEFYEYMLTYSPYDQVKKQKYPNLLVTTGLFDSQVQYWEPAKWVAKLRDTKTDDNLLILDCDMDTGHGGASGRFKRYKSTALEYAFILDLQDIKE